MYWKWKETFVHFKIPTINILIFVKNKSKQTKERKKAKLQWPPLSTCVHITRWKNKRKKINTTFSPLWKKQTTPIKQTNKMLPYLVKWSFPMQIHTYHKKNDAIALLYQVNEKWIKKKFLCSYSNCWCVQKIPHTNILLLLLNTYPIIFLNS